MSQRHILTALAVILAAGPSVGQKDQPYAGQEQRQIASLSADEVQGYLEARGMGLAKAAELNGYPGPMHVLEFQQELALSDAQRVRIKAVMDAMKAEGRALGQRYVEAEAAVDAAFRARAAPQEITARIVAADTLRSAIRVAHLAAHMETTPVLTVDQQKRYATLRGYGDGAGHGHGQQHNKQ